MSQAESLRRFNLAFLRYAGYGESEIVNLGDLTNLSEDKMNKLMHDKAITRFAFVYKT